MTSIMASLKQQTRVHHEALHQVVNLKDLLSSPTAYASALRRYYVATEPLESGLQEFARRSPFAADPQWIMRFEKTRWLRSDLIDLKSIVPKTTPPVLVQDLETFAGRAYVTEGMTLGARQIARLIQERLGFDQQHGAKFFAAYGGQTGKQWNAFAQWMHDANLDHAKTIMHAQATFRRYQQMLAATPV